MKNAPPQRVIAYIDGFNLYFGLKAANFRRYYWLDLVALCQNLLKPHQTLAAVKYFTARIAGPRPSDSPQRTAALGAKRQRQTDYLDALTTLPLLTLTEGHYLAKSVCCRRCGNQWCKHEEKMTDVNIATALLLDASDNAFDTALVLSGDSDLTPPITAVRSRFPAKRVVMAFPPKRRATQLEQAANAYFTINRAKLAQSQLPGRVALPSGHMVSRPSCWQ